MHWDGSSFTWQQPCNNQITLMTVSTPLGWIYLLINKCAKKGYRHSFRITCNNSTVNKPRKCRIHMAVPLTWIYIYMRQSKMYILLWNWTLQATDMLAYSLNTELKKAVSRHNRHLGHIGLQSLQAWFMTSQAQIATQNCSTHIYVARCLSFWDVSLKTKKQTAVYKSSEKLLWL